MMKISLQSIYNWYRDTLRNPKYRWWVVLGTLAYIVSPFDLAPDFFPIAGQIDDLVLLTLLFTEVYTLGNEWIESRKKPQEVADNTGADTVEVNAVSVD